MGWCPVATSPDPSPGPDSKPFKADGDEQQRVAAVLSAPSRIDAQTIEHMEEVLRHCRQLDYTLGPQAALNTVLAQRDLARALVPECPAALQPRLLSSLSEASRQAGWLSFDLKQFDNAGYYYEDARALAHEAQNIGLGAFVLLWFRADNSLFLVGESREHPMHVAGLFTIFDVTGDLTFRPGVEVDFLATANVVVPSAVPFIGGDTLGGLGFFFACAAFACIVAYAACAAASASPT